MQTSSQNKNENMPWRQTLESLIQYVLSDHSINKTKIVETYAQPNLENILIAAPNNVKLCTYTQFYTVCQFDSMV